ncbi:MAG: class I SAM-dependent methyltransferase [Candidatus Methylomirabilales bacterium]
MTAGSALQDVSCNLCGADDAERLTTSREFPIVRCRACGLVYVNPRPTAEDLVSLYADYHTRDGGDEASWDRLMGRIFRESAERLCSSRNGSRPGRLLDIGCGYGAFVAAMRERGWDAEGVDPSPTVVAAAVKKGRRVRLGTLDGIRGEDEPYDAVTMFYVLEHLPDPMTALRKVSDLLAPEGMLLIRVPHTTPIVRLLSPLGLGGALYDPPFHVYDFSPTVLREMLRRTGFVDVKTFPGEPTVPSRLGARIATAIFGALAAGVHALTRGMVLLPGVSKTTMARKPSA